MRISMVLHMPPPPPDVEEEEWNGGMLLMVVDVAIQLYKVFSAHERPRICLASEGSKIQNR